jgi:DNA-binding transcriptional LysR family regulator
MRQHPGIGIELLNSGEMVDLVAGRFDLAIRLGWLRESSLRATRLGGFEQVVAASPAYLTAHGLPRRPQDLARHRWIAFTLLRNPLTWAFTSRGGRQSSVRVTAVASTNSTASLHAFMREGVGIAVLPDFLLAEDIAAGRLTRLLPTWKLPSGGIYAVYPNARYTSAKVRAFIDFLRQLPPESRLPGADG